MIEEMLAYNREFVRSKGYEKFQTSKFPDKKIAILTCMDTRLVELLPAALGIRNGDVKLIKNAGGMITGPFDSAVRSLLVGIIELGVEEVMVIGHTDCGVAHINADMMIRHLIQRGISQDHIDMMRYCGLDFEAWLRGSTAWRTPWRRPWTCCATIPLCPPMSPSEATSSTPKPAS